MKKTLFITLLLISNFVLSQSKPNPFPRGIETTFIDPLKAYTLVELNAMTNIELGRKAFNSEDVGVTGVWRTWNGIEWVLLGGSGGGTGDNIYTADGITPASSTRFFDIGEFGNFYIRNHDYSNYIYFNSFNLELRNTNGNLRFRTGTGGTADSNNVGDVWTATSTVGDGHWAANTGAFDFAANHTYTGLNTYNNTSFFNTPSNGTGVGVVTNSGNGVSSLVNSGQTGYAYTAGINGQNGLLFTVDGLGNVVANSFTGDGSGLTNLPITGFDVASNYNVTGNWDFSTGIVQFNNGVTFDANVDFNGLINASGGIDMQDAPVNNVLAGVSPTDAVNKEQLDTAIAGVSSGGTSIVVKSTTGGADYVDTFYTTLSPFILDVADGLVNLPNNAGTVYDTQKPTEIPSFYDGTKILGQDGNYYSLTIEFEVRPTSAAADIRLKTSIDIGGAVGEIYPRDFSLTKGNGVEHYYLSSFLYYSRNTFEANGGTIKIQALNGPVEIYNVRYVFALIHYAGDSSTPALTADQYAGITNATGATALNPFVTSNEVKTIYEANADTNAFTDAEKSNLATNTSKISYTDSAQVTQNTSNISTIQSEQTAQDAAIALNTAKTSVNTAATEITYSASMSDAYTSAQPNRYVTMAGDGTLTITGTIVNGDNAKLKINGTGTITLTNGDASTLLVTVSGTPKLVFWDADENDNVVWYQDENSGGNGAVAVQNATGDGTTTIDWSVSPFMDFTFGAQNETITMSAPTYPERLRLKLTQDGTGSRTVTWVNDIYAPSGIMPTLSTGAGDIDVINLFWNGVDFELDEDFNDYQLVAGLDVTAPTAPTSLASSNITSSGATLTWVAATDNVAVTNYKVYQDAVEIASLGNVLTYNVTGLASSTSYNFTVTALDAALNESVVSNLVSVTTNGETPIDVTGLTFISSGTGSFPASNSFDNDTATYSATTLQATGWVGVDFGSAVTISKVELLGRQSDNANGLRINGCQVQWSNDNSTWNNIGTEVSGVNSSNYTSYSVITFTSQSARYWRWINNISTTYSGNITEAKFYN